jgi:hypothetical protein
MIGPHMPGITDRPNVKHIPCNAWDIFEIDPQTWEHMASCAAFNAYQDYKSGNWPGYVIVVQSEFGSADVDAATLHRDAVQGYLDKIFTASFASEHPDREKFAKLLKTTPTPGCFWACLFVRGGKEDLGALYGVELRAVPFFSEEQARDFALDVKPLAQKAD